MKIPGCVPFPGDHSEGGEHNEACRQCSVCLAQLQVTRECVCPVPGA